MVNFIPTDLQGVGRTASTSPPARPASSPPPPTPRETVVDQRVVALRGMFPDYDDLILQSVLESAGGNQDRAIDILLGMTDPDFQAEVPPPQAPAPVVAPILSQTDLDEQFARQLVLQEQQQETELWLQSNPDARAQLQSQGRGQVPPGVYHSSRPLGTAAAGGGGARSPQQQGQGQGGTANEFQEQFTKIAESGKKTFGNIFSKVKAKLQEFEQGRPLNQPPASGSAPYPSYATHPGQQQQATWSPPPAQAQAAYFDPNPNPSSTSPPPPTGARSPPNMNEVQGYDVSQPPSSSPPNTTTTTTTTSTSTTTQLQREPSPQPQSQPQSISMSMPVPPPQGTPIDAGKLGILPKKPVSLLRDPAPTSPSSSSASAGASASASPPGASGAAAAVAGIGAGAAVGAVGLAATHSAHSDGTDQDDYNHYNDDDEDDDGLEYAENPFDDDAGAGKK